MLNLGYFKALPTEYVLRYGSGRLRREGEGLAFFYWKHSTQIVAVPTASMDTGFVFNEATSTFQAVTIQGQLTYRIHNPKQASGLLNFTIDPVTRRYLSDDPDRLAQLAVVAHRRRRVHQQAQVQLVLGLEQLDEQLPGPGVQGVVDPPVVVARVVFALVGEVQRVAEAGRAVLTGEPAGKAPPAGQLQPLQLGEQRRFEQFVHGPPRTPADGAGTASSSSSTSCAVVIPSAVAS